MSAQCNLTSPTDVNLIVAKCTRLELYVIGPTGLTVVLDTNVCKVSSRCPRLRPLSGVGRQTHPEHAAGQRGVNFACVQYARYASCAGWMQFRTVRCKPLSSMPGMASVIST